jgi:hypothetical protein
VHKWYKPHAFQGSYVISNLEHARNLGELCEHTFSIQMFFHTYVYSLCKQNDI